MPWQQKEVPEVGVAGLVFFIHTEMDAIFQPIKKSDTYQIKLFLDIKNSISLYQEMNSWYQEIFIISWYQEIEFLISRNAEWIVKRCGAS